MGDFSDIQDPVLYLISGKSLLLAITHPAQKTNPTIIIHVFFFVRLPSAIPRETFWIYPSQCRIVLLLFISTFFLQFLWFFASVSV